MRHPWLLALSIIGVAVGVAVVVGIDIANASSKRAFTLSADAVAGSATHEIVGVGGQLPDSVYTSLRLEHPSISAAPVLAGYMRIEDCGRRVFQVLGIDPLSDGEIRSYTGGRSLDLGILLTRPSAALSRPIAEECGLGVGDSIRVRVGGVSSEMVVGGLIEPNDGRSAAALETIAITD
ncbi:MAG: ABC transporter permease, partial [Rhodothermales bacterium]|nr:ABC transporter permease [Rhodothermales bacterium]